VLSAMARDFLVIPVSTVSSKSAFSLGGWILGDNWSSMTPQILEALVCCNDWLYKYPPNQGNFHYLKFNQMLHMHRSDIVISMCTPVGSLGVMRSLNGYWRYISEYASCRKFSVAVHAIFSESFHFPHY
jgi:hypothetical protein